MYNYHGGHNDYQPGFFYFDLQFRPKITGTSRKTQNYGKMAIMISRSEIILVFFGVKQRIGGYERREKRERGVDYAAACCHAL